MMFYHCFMDSKGYFFARRVKDENIPFEHKGVKLIKLEDDTPYDQVPSLLRQEFFKETVFQSNSVSQTKKIDIVQFIN